jgi:hypothetical protein
MMRAVSPAARRSIAGKARASPARPGGQGKRNKPGQGRRWTPRGWRRAGSLSVTGSRAAGRSRRIAGRWRAGSALRRHSGTGRARAGRAARRAGFWWRRIRGRLRKRGKPAAGRPVAIPASATTTPAAPTTTAAPQPAPKPGAAFSPNGSQPAATTTTGGQHMGSQVAAAAEQAGEAISQLPCPDSGLELDTSLQDLHMIPEQVGQGLVAYADTIEAEFPAEAALVEAIREAGQAIMGQADVMNEAYHTHRQVHEKEMQMVEEPRGDESLWPKETA